MTGGLSRGVVQTDAAINISLSKLCGLKEDKNQRETRETRY